MGRCTKLLEKAKSSSSNLRFEELCKLAECNGWELKRQNGTSHKIYVNPNLRPEQGRRMNFQNWNGEAKSYQVEQLLDAIENLNK